MPINFTFLVLISLVFGALISITDFYEKKQPRLNISFIAGISLAYFFLVLLPEITNKMPQFPMQLEFIEYFFVLIGFVFVHISEKLILQNVESKSQRRMRKLIEKDKTLEIAEDNIERIMTREIQQEDLDEIALKDIAKTSSHLHKRGEEFEDKINQYKLKIQYHISEDLRNLRFFTHFAYHFLGGIIVVGLLAFDLIAGIFFFFFIWFRAIITYRSRSRIIFTDLEIYEKSDVKENQVKKYIQALASLFGVLLGLILDLVKFEYTELFYILYSFISGVILYTIVREVLPEKEKGKPIYFLIGFIAFTVVVFTLNIFTSLI